MALFSRKKNRDTPAQTGRGDAATLESPAPPTATVDRPTHPTHSKTPPRPFRTGEPALEQEIFAIGSKFLDIARSKQGGVFSSQFWSDKLMDWAMKDEAFKIQFFRFVDTFPALKTPEQIHEHLVDYMSQPGVSPPPGMELMTKAGGIAKGLFSSQMTKQITGMARKFIAGENAEAAAPVLKDLWKRGMCFSVDLLGEACISERVADQYQERYLDLVNNLPGLVAEFQPDNRLESDHLGPIPRVNVSIKITSLDAGVDPLDHDASLDRLTERLGPLLEAAHKNNVHINFDIEQYEFKDLTLDLFERCCEKHEFPAGLALQAYLRSGLDDAKRVIEWARRTDRQITVRLVKGAYWDYETIHAEQQGWPVPVWSRKQDSDACFEHMATMFIENMPRTAGQGGVKLALGSHNARSIAHSIATIRKNDFPDHALELQMLHGMGDPLKAAAIEMNMRREYVPIGELLVGMAYFVRRLLENTSNESWLRASFAEGSSAERLLADPVSIEPDEPDHGIALIREAPERHALSPAVAEIASGRRLFNEPHRDFAETEARQRIAAALEDMEPDASPLGFSSYASCIESARNAAQEWESVSVVKRAQLLIGIAAQLRATRDSLAALLIQSLGCTWREADAETCDAIDSFEFYARNAVQMLDAHRLGKFVGEHNHNLPGPHGVTTARIPVWHPLSTAAAASAASLATGNGCVLMPAEGSRRVVGEFAELLQANGCPANLLAVAESNHGDHANSAQGVRADAFTVTHENNGHCAPAVVEYPTRNAMIIDASADLNEAVTAVQEGALSRAGRSPFACAFAIAVDTAYESFLDRLVETVQEMTVGDPRQPGTDMGFIADDDHAQAVKAHIETAKSLGRVVNKTELPPRAQLAADRLYVMPHVIANVSLDAARDISPPLGPIVYVLALNRLLKALNMANAICGPYSLAGVYSRKPSNIESARDQLHTGIISINAPFHMLRIARQPVPMSGRGSALYLQHFVHSRTTMENTMRRGFAPEL